MTKQEIEVEVRMAAFKLAREHRIPPGVAYRMVSRAARRTRGLSVGLGADSIPTQPVAIAGTPPGAPAILANISAAGDDPAVVAARGAVSKWSWLIPVGGLLMSLKRKVSELRTPASAAIVGMKRR